MVGGDSDPAAVRADIERARAEIFESVLALRQQVGAAFDPRRWIRRRPLLAVGIAFAVGILIGRRARE